MADEKGAFEVAFCVWCRNQDHANCDDEACVCATLGHKSPEDNMAEGWKDIAELLADDELEDEQREIVKMMGMLYTTIEKQAEAIKTIIAAGDALYVEVCKVHKLDEIDNLARAWYEARVKARDGLV